MTRVRPKDRCREIARPLRVPSWPCPGGPYPESWWLEQDRRPHAEHRGRNQIAAGIPRCAVACRDETGQNQRCETGRINSGHLIDGGQAGVSDGGGEKRGV